MQITSNPAINSISLYVYMDKDIIYAPQYDTMKRITGVSKMCCDGVIQCLEKEKVSILGSLTPLFTTDLKHSA